MKFIGRERELKQLNDIYQRDGFQMIVVYGRRRVGKTTLLNQFAIGKRAVFFMATRTSAAENLADLSRTIAADSRLDLNIRFAGYEDAFHALTIQSQESRLVVILDEYPYLMESAEGISSVLQRMIDQEWLHSNIMLILCGSSISMMEDEVLSEKSPLYGRRTAQMDVKPFDYLTSAAFVPEYSSEDKAISYGITGGIPKYLSMLDPRINIHENIERLFFDDAGFFYEEPENLLQQEFRNVASYNTVLQAIAQGTVQIAEISQTTHMDSSLVSQILRKLIRVRIVRKDVPVPPQQNKRFTQYVLQDGMFRFWYKYVATAVNAVERGYGTEFYRQRVKPAIHDYMGQEFELMCQEYLWNHSMDFSSELFITNVGKWRGHDNEKRQPADIDVVGIDDVSKAAIIGECKFKNELMGQNELMTLEDRARLIRPYEAKEFLLFSLSGFQSNLKDMNTDTRVRLITLENMYQ